MTSSPPARLRRLDALRGFAAVYVVVHHTLPYEHLVAGVDVGWLWRFGQEAVVLFFLLSGFVIRLSVERRPLDPRQWYLARAVRLYAPLVPVLALSWLLASLSAGRAVDIEALTLAGNLAMLQDLDWAKPGTLVAPYLDNDPLWSLSYEWWFYVAFLPLFLAIPQPETRNRAAVLIAMTGAIAYIVWPWFPFRVMLAFGIWWCGAMLAEAWLGARAKRPAVWVKALALVGSLTALLALDAWLTARADQPLLMGLHPMLELRHVAFATFAIAIAWGWSRLAWIGFDRTFGAFACVSPISYGLYIAHHPLLAGAHYLDGVAPPGIRYPLYIALLLLAAWWLERVWYPWVRRLVLEPYRPAATH